MNKAGFNGIFRVNRAGHFNVPYGRNSKTSICAPDALRAAHEALRTTSLRSADYRTTLADVERGDLVYIDSPHAPRSRTASFTAYTPSAFGDREQRELEVARRLVASGVHVILSNADTPFIRSLYADFEAIRVRCPRAINSDATKRGDVGELIIRGTR